MLGQLCMVGHIPGDDVNAEDGDDEAPKTTVPKKTIEALDESWKAMTGR